MTIERDKFIRVRTTSRKRARELVGVAYDTPVKIECMDSGEVVYLVWTESGTIPPDGQGWEIPYEAYEAKLKAARC